MCQPDAQDDKSDADHPAERFRQEYPTASQIIRGFDLPDEDDPIHIDDHYNGDEVTIMYDLPTGDFRDVEVELCEHWCFHRGTLTRRHPVPEFTPPPKSEAEQARTELLDDLDNRLRRGEASLQEYLNNAHGVIEQVRLQSRIEGLRVVRDWLRSYR